MCILEQNTPFQSCYCNEWLLDISFAMPSGGMQFGLCADYKVHTNLLPCYAVNAQRMDLMYDITGPRSLQVQHPHTAESVIV
jgi:hypothetical protein